MLRPFRRRDADSLAEAVNASMADLTPWLPWARPGYDRGDALRFIRDSSAAWAEGRAFDFAIRSTADPEAHLGNVSVWHTSRREQAGEVGYWVRSTLTGRGIGTEATCRVLQVAFDELRLHRVVLRIATGNVASERIAERLGFLQEGLLRKEVLVGDRWLDHSLWGMLEEEFETHRARFTAEGWLDGT